VDKIFIKNLEIETTVGITEKERSQRQAVLLDLYVFRDLAIAGATDDPRKTSSYTKIRDSVQTFVSSGEFNLCEGIAEGVASLLLKKPLVKKVKVRVRKKKYSLEPSIGVEITRMRNA
jgi:FolB domain-containing protein